MNKNLYQQTLYEVYKNKETFGYTVSKYDNMFVMLWNTPKLSCFNAAHCEKITEKEIDIINRNFGEYEMVLNSYSKPDNTHLNLVYKGTGKAMLYESSDLLPENKDFEIKLVTTLQELECFCNIVKEAFNSKYNIEDLKSSLAADLNLDNCHRYIGYINGVGAGAIEMARGKEASLISWVGVKEDFRRQGLCKAMLSYTMNKEIERGITKFVLLAGAMGEKIYAKYGFTILTERYSYTIYEG